MRNIIALTTAALTFSLGGFALASERDARCATPSDREIIASSVITRSLEGIGYQIQRMEKEHGCYEIRAVNDSGYPIKVMYAPATGELLSARLR